MDMLSGSSFYDSLNKFLIGLLLLLPWVCIITDLNNFQIVLLGAGCWIIGLFFWALCDLWIFRRCRCSYLGNNCEKWIAESYKDVLEDKWKNKLGEIPEDIMFDYYKAYYSIQKLGLLGSIPVLESFSAFFRNLFVVLIYWIFIAAITELGCHLRICLCLDKCEYCDFSQTYAWCIIIPLVLMASLSLYFRKLTEKHIQRSVIETDRFSKINH